MTLNNIRIDTFPDLLLARGFGFRTQTTLEFAEADKQDVDLKALFN